MRTLPVLAFLVFCLFYACQHPDQKHVAAKAITKSKPHRDTLRQNLWQSRKITVIYPKTMDSIVRRLSDAMGSFDIRFLHVEEVKTADMKGSLFLIGTPTSNPWLRKLQPRPAIVIKNNQINLNGDPIPKTAVAFLSLYPNPRSAKHPIFIATSPDEASLKRLLKQRLEKGFSAFGWGSWQYELYQGHYRIKCGKYHPETWTPVVEQHPAATASNASTVTSPYFKYHWHGDSTAKAYYHKLVKACNRQTGAILSFCDTTWNGEVPALHLFPSMEAKGLMLNNTSPLQVSIDNQRVDAIANPIYATHWLGLQNQLLIRQLLGKPGMPLLESGLAITFNPEWQRYGFRYWISPLNRGGLLPSLSDLEAFWVNEHHSPFIKQVAAAAFCDFLIRSWGKNTFLERYTDWQPDQQKLLAMEDSWQQYLKEKEIVLDKKHPTLPYLKGFNFAHEGYSVFNGYGSKLAAEMLKEQAALGANTVAIVPYSYMRSPEEPTPLPIMNRAGTENDESVIRDLQYARQLGLRTVLKPQIWLGGGHWPGDVQMQNEAEWATFFRHYTSWIAHYALLAEIYQADVFCIGVEFAKATLEKPEDWRKVIEVVRSVYSGPITYAANWGPEFEKLRFWGELDFIGLNCYYPLSQANNPSAAELAGRFSQVLQKAKAVSKSYERPVLLTEIGFTSTTTPWLQPHQDGDGATYSGTAQLKCYQIVTRALAQETEWCRGILWWKYPSYPSLGGEGHTGFTPNNKPTEQQLPMLFDQLPD